MKMKTFETALEADAQGVCNTARFFASLTTRSTSGTQYGQ
jgi:hypothetical protein